MIRRHSIAVALSVLGAMAGCGLIHAGPSSNRSLRPGAVARTFDAPVGSVVQAAFDASGVEVDLDQELDFGLKPGAVRLSGDERGVVKTVGEPANEILAAEGLPAGIANWRGKTRDGRPVTVWVLPLDDPKKTQATILVGRHGDPELSEAFLDRVADKLAHPTTRQGNPAPEKPGAELPAGQPPKDGPRPGPGGTDR